MKHTEPRLVFVRLTSVYGSRGNIGNRVFSRPEDHRPPRLAAAVRPRRTSATVALAVAAVALTLFTREARSSGPVATTDQPPSLAVTPAASPHPSVTRHDYGSTSQGLQNRARSSGVDDAAAAAAVGRRYDRFPEVRPTPARRVPYADYPGAWYYSNRGMSLEANTIADNQPTSLTRRQMLNIPTEKNLMSSFLQMPTMNEVSWRKIGKMVLIKFGLAKMKTFSFIKILYFLIFMVKFFLTTFFFKFLLLFKFFKVFKFLILPVSLFPLLSSIILSLIPSFFPMVNTLISPASDRYSVVDYVIPTQSTVSQEVLLVPDDITFIRPVGQTVVTEIIDPINEILNDVNSIRYDTSDLIDPTLKLFQKELSSEKCIERIACKMATTGKASIIPFWINWVLHRVSRLVPQNQLLYYLKTYSDVTDELHNNLPNPENWETWCSERYNCDNNDATNDFK